MDREVDTGRLEAFSDGVFAIAITLLILEVRVPGGEGSLAHRFLAAWPSYASFLIAFALIGTMWLNHHRVFRAIRSVDHGLIVANLALLLVVSVIPFPTKLVGDELANGSFADERTAVIVYGLTFVAVSIVFPVLWLTAARGAGRLLHPGVSRAEVRAQTRRNLIGFPTFSTATVIALWSPRASLVVFGVVMVLYLLPSDRLDRLLVPELGATGREAPREGVSAPADPGGGEP